MTSGYALHLDAYADLDDIRYYLWEQAKAGAAKTVPRTVASDGKTVRGRQSEVLRAGVRVARSRRVPG